MAIIPGTANPDFLTGTVTADLIEGEASDDLIYGLDGNDSLAGGTGDDILYGGSGDDTIDGGAGEDLFYGQSGLDTVTYASALAGLTLNMTDNSLSTGDAAGDFYLSVENFVLTGHDDTFIGNSFANRASGGIGNDLLSGLTGDDRLFGDAGDDTLVGGIGADSLTGGLGVDQASYATATGAVVLDLVNMANSTGDAQSDVLIEIERVRMTGFDDRVHLSSTLRHAEGGDGHDVILGSAGRDTMLGDAGNDSLTGGASNDLLQGDAGTDFLDGGTGDDTLLGGADNDVILGGFGADQMDGGVGDDLVSYGSKVTVDLATPSSSTGFALGDTFAGIETIGFLEGIGSRFIGNAASLRVLLASGSLTATAGSGAETFVATGGSLAVTYATTPVTGVSFAFAQGQMIGTRGALGDRLDGVSSLTLSTRNDHFDATGFDGLRPLPSIILAGFGSDSLVLNHAGVATIDAGGGNDTVSGSMDGGTLALGSGADTVTMTVAGPISMGAPTFVTAGSGNDSVTVESLDAAMDVSGDAGHDTIILQDFGTVGGYSVDGGDGNDTITTTSVGAAVVGGLGDDTLTVTALGAAPDVSGDDGNDTIVLTALAGTAEGGQGNDMIRFQLAISGGGTAVVKGDSGDDTLTIDGLFLFGGAFGNLAEYDGGTGNDVLQDETPADFMSASFVFTTGWGNDTVTGFDDGVDRIRFDSIAGLDFADLILAGDGTQTLVTFGSDTILLEGLDLALFSAADVVFA